MTDFVEELKWRGLLHDTMPGTQEQLNKEMTSAYIGFDPTADSLHVGSLSQIMTLVRFQLAGHKPLALVGGATGMVGDPSGKSQERNLLDEETLNKNVAGIQKQLEKFLNFNCGANSAELVNNFDWFKNFSFLDFIRDAGKHITVNYMMAKDSVKKRIDGTTGTGMSFTEFSYQLIQGYDFFHLYKEKNCLLQMGGSDQWGNITTGTEFIRRKAGGHAFALTTQLITKADGSKFGKSESGNVWLDPKKTSPYKFYQFWINTSDEDAQKYIRYFTLLTKEEIEAMEVEHFKDKGKRILQKALAKDITIRVHSEKEWEAAVVASDILFKGSIEDLCSLDDKTFQEVFEGSPQYEIKEEELIGGINITDLLAISAQIFTGKGKAREMIKGGGVKINKQKITDPESIVSSKDLIKGKYIVAQTGKNYHLLKV